MSKDKIQGGSDGDVQRGRVRQAGVLGAEKGRGKGG